MILKLLFQAACVATLIGMAYPEKTNYADVDRKEVVYVEGKDMTTIHHEVDSMVTSIGGNVVIDNIETYLVKFKPTDTDCDLDLLVDIVFFDNGYSFVIRKNFKIFDKDFERCDKETDERREELYFTLLSLYE